MDEAAVIQYITDTFAGVDLIQASGDAFFIYDPDRNLPPNQQHPFATLVTNDNHDRASDLGRPSVYRLNVGVSKDTYRTLFGPQPAFPIDGGVIDTGHDFTVLDQLPPHPVYAAMSWVCVLNPSEATFQTVRPLLAEAYELVAEKYAKRASRG